MAPQDEDDEVDGSEATLRSPAVARPASEPLTEVVSRLELRRSMMPVPADELATAAFLPVKRPTPVAEPAPTASDDRTELLVVQPVTRAPESGLVLGRPPHDVTDGTRFIEDMTDPNLFRPRARQTSVAVTPTAAPVVAPRWPWQTILIVVNVGLIAAIVIAVMTLR